MLRSCCFRPLERCLGRRSGDGLLWHTDLKPHATGDFSIAAVQANSSMEDQSQVFASPSTTYVGVYDGHGGPEASRFVNRHLFPHLHKFEKEQGGLSADVIKKAFCATEEDFTRLVKQYMPVKPQIASVGSCCIVGAISDGELYVANLGDSRAVLGRRGYDGERNSVVAERLSTDHNVSSEKVRREVQSLHPDDSSIVLHCQGVWRIRGIIQVSRSIGDIYLKKPDPIFRQFGNLVPMRRPVLTAEPSIVTRKLKTQDLFVIFASDGLWEHLADDVAVQIVFEHPRAGIAKRLVVAALEEAAKKRQISCKDLNKVEKGIRRHFHDDISVIVVYLDHHKTSSSSKRKVGSTLGPINAPVDIFSYNLSEVENSSDKVSPRLVY